MSISKWLMLATLVCAVVAGSACTQKAADQTTTPPGAALDKTKEGSDAALDLTKEGADKALDAANEGAAAVIAGYERGLIEGRNAGRGDRQGSQGWDLEGQSELETADSGYDAQVGPRADYQAGYRNGFRRAYREGYGPRTGAALDKTKEGSDTALDATKEGAAKALDATQEGAAAVTAGYARGLIEGRNAGREDRQGSQGWDLEGQSELETADSGYDAQVGPRADYQAGYRNGFRRAYREGYGPR